MKHFRHFFGAAVVILFILVSVTARAARSETPASRTFSLAGRPMAELSGRQDPACQEEEIKPYKFIVMMDLGVASLKKASADRLRTSVSGFTFGLGGGVVFFKFFDIGAGFGLVFLKDKDPFSNWTTGGTKTSSVTPLYYYAQAGVQVPIPIKNKSGLFPFWISAHEGVMGVSATREIANCIDCDKEKLSFTGRTYFKPEIRFQIARGVFVGTAYTIFCNCSDFKNMVTFFFSGNFARAR